MTYNEFHYYSYAKSNAEYGILSKAYIYILGNSKSKAREIMSEFKDHNFSTYEVELLYKLCKILYEVEFGDYTVREKIGRYCKFLDYDRVINKQFLSYSELCILLRISNFEKQISKYDTAECLYSKLLSSGFYISSNSRFALPAIFVELAKIYGSKKDYLKSLEVSNMGIKYSIENNDSNALPNLYYLSALTEHNLGMRDKFEDNLINCLVTTISNQDIASYKLYSKLIRDEFKLDSNQILYLLTNKIKQIEL